MRILHTSDLHLKADRLETINALEAILDIAKKKKADLLTISGDIFDSPKDADTLKSTTRALFVGLPFRVIAIPGNHDGKIFTKGFDFGFDVSIDEPWGQTEFGDVCLVTVPYTDTPSEELVPRLATVGLDAKTRILLLHCTLDLGFDTSHYGEETGPRYFPVTRSSLAELGYQYVLAGHFHKNCEIIKLESSCEFIYPGSPLSHTWKETGKRHVVLVDTDKRLATKIPLSTRYYDRLILSAIPGKESQTLSELQIWYAQRCDDLCDLEVTIGGVIERDEKRFRNALKKAAPKASIQFDFKDVRAVLNHSLYKRFQKRMDSEIETSDKEAVSRILMEVMSGLIAGGELGS